MPLDAMSIQTTPPDNTLKERRRSERRHPIRKGQSERASATSQQHDLHNRQLRIQNLLGLLSLQLNQSLGQHKEFHKLINAELDTLREIPDASSLNALQINLTSNLEALSHESHAAADQLRHALKHLKHLENHNRQLSEEITEVYLLSQTDELTELPNRRAFTRQLEEEVSRVKRYGNKLPLALIDIDGFKAINDKYGHTAGDRVLQIYAKNMLTLFRHHDMVTRYGGEEFAILLPNTNSEGAKRAVDKIQRHMAKCHFEFNEFKFPMPTFSAGIALYSLHETPEELIKRADNALYRAKNSGRNLIMEA